MGKAAKIVPEGRRGHWVAEKATAKPLLQNEDNRPCSTGFLIASFTILCFFKKTNE